MWILLGINGLVDTYRHIEKTQFEVDVIMASDTPNETKKTFILRDARTGWEHSLTGDSLGAALDHAEDLIEDMWES